MIEVVVFSWAFALIICIYIYLIKKTKSNEKK